MQPTALRTAGGLVAILGLTFAAMLLVLPRVTDTYPLVVLSGSMTPTIPVGSMVYVEAVPPEDIRPEDTITFQSSASSNLISHRVLEIGQDDGGNIQFTTRGDANDAVDKDPVTVDRYRGRVNFHIPFIGYIRSFVASPLGLVLIGIAATGVWLADRVRLRSTPDNPVTDQSQAPSAPARQAQAPAFESANLHSGAVLTPAATLVHSEPARHIVSQMALIRIEVVRVRRAELLQVADLMRAQIVELTDQTLTLTVSGTPEHVRDVTSFLRDNFHVVEVRESDLVHLGQAPATTQPPPPPSWWTGRSEETPAIAQTSGEQTGESVEDIDDERTSSAAAASIEAEMSASAADETIEVDAADRPWIRLVGPVRSVDDVKDSA